MKNLLYLLVFLLTFFSCQSNNNTKSDKKDTFSEKLKIAREKDGEWKKYIADLEKNFNEEKSIEAQIKLWTRFEAYNPYSGNFEFLKDKITQKHNIKSYKQIVIPTRDGIELNGWFIPLKNPKGTVIVLHGWSSDVDFGLNQSKFLLDLGYQILIYNARFWSFWEKPYDYVGFIGNDLDDIEDVIKFASQIKEIDMNKLGIMGFSYGAEKSILAGAKYKDLRFVIADASPVRESRNNTDEYKSFSKIIKEKYNFDLLSSDFNVLNVVKKISPRPLLLLHGEKDTTVPLDCSKMIFEKADDPKLLHTFPNSGHCLSMMTSDKESYFKAVGDFLKKYNE